MSDSSAPPVSAPDPQWQQPTPPPNLPPAPLALVGASKWFGDVVAVSEVTFNVGPGVTALLGPNLSLIHI